ncbi:MAG: hypothetical protein R3Y58_14455, partial [Eubacteriales bacterium]
MSTKNSTEAQEEVIEDVVEIEEVVEKPYTLRGLAGKDIFPMSRIISKIGINEFTKAFESQEIRKLASSFFKKKDKKVKKDGESSEEIEETTEVEDTPEVEEERADHTMIVGISIAVEIANTIFTNISACEIELYIFLSGLSGYSKEEVAELPMNVFLEMIVDVCRKEEFKDFIKV